MSKQFKISSKEEMNELGFNKKLTVEEVEAFMNDADSRVKMTEYIVERYSKEEFKANHRKYIVEAINNLLDENPAMKIKNILSNLVN